MGPQAWRPDDHVAPPPRRAPPVPAQSSRPPQRPVERLSAASGRAPAAALRPDRRRTDVKPPMVLAVAALLFGVLATANSGGYRYGISDQAFYATAVVKDLHPSFFPRDTPLLNAQAGLQWSDEIVAALSRTLHVDLPPLFLAIYVLTLTSLFL